mgnify:CR=1 FL=1|jgi:hypothetical protein
MTATGRASVETSLLSGTAFFGAVLFAVMAIHSMLASAADQRVETGRTLYSQTCVYCH